MTTNGYTTLVSCRIENRTLDIIDQFCARSTYRNRSSVINQALAKVFSGKDYSELYEFLYE